MANEIRTTINVSVSKGNFRDTFNPGQISMDQATGSGGSPGTVSIGTGEENVSFGDVAPGLVVMQNLDATNYVEFGADDGGTMKKLGKISPGKIAYFELGASVTLRMKANTAACLVLIKGYAV